MSLAVLLGLLLAHTSLYASGPVSSVFTTTTAATPFTYLGSDGNTYNWGQGDDLRITGFQFNGTDFELESPASQVIIRRVDNPQASGTPCGVFVEKSTSYGFPGNINYEATSPDDGAGNCDLESVIAGDIINRGALDVFDNFVGTQAKNIERIDFIFPEGLIPPSDPLLLAETGHVVTEKSGNNPVQIAAILSLDGSGNPASYGTLLRVNRGADPNADVAYGFPGLGMNFDFLVNNQNPPHETLIRVGQSTEGLGIAFVTLDDLGVGAGVEYYGFSYFGADIDDTVHTLSDVSTFPTNTAEAVPDDGQADIYGGTAGYFVNQTLINQQPDAVDDTAETPINTALENIDVLLNDSDPDGDDLTLSIVSQPPNGTVTIDDNGTPDPTDDTIDYLPDPNFAGDDSFVYQVSDGASGSLTTDTATVTVTVQGPPNAVDDTALTDVDALVNIDVLDNDNDPNGDDLSIAAVSDPANGTAVINDMGTPADLTDDIIDYTPDTGFVGIDTFTYDVADGEGGVSTATVVVTVNAAPTATDDTVITAIDTAVVINVVDNDSDQNDDPLTISVTVPPSDGTAVILDGGTPADPSDDTIEYTPDPGFEGTDTFTYQVDDGNGGTATATVTVTVSDDADGDGINDAIDLDDDNDGIPDSVEGAGDFDGDGIDNVFDTDSDGDGILDLAESGLSDAEIAALDSDGDGVIDPANSFGANGLADDVETAAESGTVDYDNDGTDDDPRNSDSDPNPDFLDLDSDNDGITDVIEAGLEDTDGDGEADAGQTPIVAAPDTDGDGVKDVHDLDSDNDGVTDTTEAGLTDDDGDGRIDGFTDADGDGYDDATAAAPPVLPDTDNDNVNDIHDLDSDNDGITDTTEAGLSDSDRDGRVDGFTDADGDGYDDATSASPAPLTDTDNDGTPDMLELDSDDDGVTDANEAGLPDANDDGIVDNFVDSNGDGLIDSLPPIAADDTATTPVDTAVLVNVTDNDTDPDGDPLQITVTVAPANGTAVVNDNGTPADFTDDTVEYTPEPGFEGTDSFTYQVDDGNGGTDTATVTITVSDDIDGDGISDAIDLDDDNDGIPDSVEGTDDFDGDGIANYLDLDSDGDGILDLAESGLSDAEIAALDADADGVIDATENFGTNGLADAVETTADSDAVDYDNDGAADAPVDTDGDSQPDFLDLDSDNDGVTDVIEAGLVDADSDGEADAGQTPIVAAPDTDGDGVKDIHDLDSDNDGVTDTTEAGLSDTDGDGRIDGFTDADGDGYDDATAATPVVLPDTDGDGVNDIHDLDSDNDGITDTTEAGLSDTDADGRVDGFTDADGDGYDDNTSASPAPVTDTDNDGIPDMLELDSDGDGVTDATEAGVPDADNDGIVDGFVDLNGDGLSDNIGAGGTDCSNCNISTGTNGGSLGLNLLLMMVGLLCVRRFLLPAETATLATAGTVLGLFGMIAMLPLSAVAESSPDVRDFNQRFYLGGSLGLSKLDPEPNCPCFDVDDDSDQGFKLHLGYDLSPRFTLEAYYADLGEAGIRDNSDGSHAGEIDYQTFGVSVLAYLFNHRSPHEADITTYDDEGLFRREGFSLFARAGVGGLENSSDLPTVRDNDAHLALGGGLEYGWRNGLAARLEYVAYDQDAHMLTLGLIKRFGETEKIGTYKPEPKAEPVVEEKPLQTVAAPVALPVDSDADGVNDPDDQCPGSTAGAMVDDKGCEVKPDITGVLEGVNFETASAVLTPEAKTVLNRVVQQLRKFPGYKIMIIGHTDNVGNPEKNKLLSLERAKSVAAYLQANGIASTTMKYDGVGDTQPRSSNDTAEGRAQNRRVELQPQ